MASVTVRTPIERFFAANDKNDQRLILNSGIDYVKKFCDTKGNHFAYHLNDRKKEALTKIGISLHPIPFLAHSHPFCKILENHILINVLPGLLGNGKWVFTSIKKGKVEKIVKLAGNVRNNVDIINRCICAKDFGRYEFEPNSVDISVNMLSKEHLFPKSFLKSVSRRKIFIHDEVHHWTHHNMIDFLEETNPQLLLFSVVFPPELLNGIKNPQNPDFYSFKVEGDKLLFFPDGCCGEMYEQPSNLDWLFKASYIETLNGLYTVKMIGSYFAHHVFQVSKGEKVTDSKRIFANFSTIDLQVIHNERFRYYDYVPIKKIHVEKIYTYLLCLKKPDVESAIAKLRQIMEDEQDCRVVEFFCKFAKDIITKFKGKIDLYETGWLEAAKDKLLERMPNGLARAFSRWHGLNIFHFLFTLDTLKISVDTQVIGRNFIYTPFQEELIQSDIFSKELPQCIDIKWQGAKMPSRGDWKLNLKISYNKTGYISDSKRFYEKIHIMSHLRNIATRNSKFQNEGCEGKRENMLLTYGRKGEIIKRENRFSFELPSFFEKRMVSGEVGSFELSYSEALFLESFKNQRKRWIEKEVDPIFRMITEEFENLEIDVCDLDEDIYIEIGETNAEIENIGERKDLGTEEEPLFEFKEKEDKYETKEEEEEKECKEMSHQSADGETIDKDFLEDICISSIGEKILIRGIDFEVIKVKGDGNCFLRAIQVSLLGHDSKYPGSRDRFLNQINALGLPIPIHLKEEIGREGTFFDHWMVQLYCNVMNIKISFLQDDQSHMLTLEPQWVKYSNEPNLHAYLFHKGEHFDAFTLIDHETEINEISKENEDDQKDDDDKKMENEDSDIFKLKDERVEVSSGEFKKLSQFVDDLSHFKSNKLRGREAFFFSESRTIDYGHNGITYKQNLIDDVEVYLPTKLKKGYNAMLVQIFEENGKIGFHRDDECVYDNDSILSINLNGTASFIIENSKREKTLIQLEDGDYVLMKEGSQRKIRHAVENCSSGRINVTFRRHVRSLRSNVRMMLDFKNFKNICLIRAIAKLDGRPIYDVAMALIKKDKDRWTAYFERSAGGSIADLEVAAKHMRFRFEVFNGSDIVKGGQSGPKFFFILENEHFSVNEEKICTREDTKLNESCEETSSEEEPEGIDFDSIHGMNKSIFFPSAIHASSLRKSFMDRTTGVMLSDMYSEHGSPVESIKISGEEELGGVEIRYLCGFAGSGKSYELQSKLIGNFREKFLVICPRAELKEDWIEKVKCSTSKVITFEVAMAKNLKKVSTLIIDELGLFPNGYLDLLIYKLKMEKNLNYKIICLFDPLQARYHSDLDSLILAEGHDLDRLTNDETVNYIAESWRLSKPFFGNFLPSLELRNEKGSPFSFECHENYLVAISEAEKKGCPIDLILVASRDEKRALKSKVKTLTFGEAQGLTVNHACIVLSEYAEKQDDLRWIVALTRARNKVSFVIMHKGGISAFLTSMVARPIHVLVTGGQFSKRRMELMVNFKLNFITRSVGKKDEIDREERLEGDPFLKPFIFLGQRENSEEIELIEPEVIEPKEKVHLCISQENFAVARNFDMIRAKEFREAKLRSMETNQFCHDYEKTNQFGSKHVAGPLRFESIFPRHRADDDLTFWMAVKKRLRFSEEYVERAKLKNSYGTGYLLYSNLKRKLDLNFSFDQGLLDECLNDFETKKLQKSKATLAAHSLRSDSDWNLDQIFLFMKSQLCTKYEKQYVDAKAGQTLACFSHLILVKFAPYCRYMEKMIRSKLKDNIYIHSNKNFNQLNEWVIKYFTEDEEKIESDYEAFDASQDEYIVSFEVCLMEDMGMPRWFINDYIDLKCTLGCKLGHFAIMRFTGEFCTFLFNTMANMAFTFARYDCDADTPIAFAGDDMCMLKNCRVVDDFEEVFEKISLKAKVVRTPNPMFCGWNLSKYGIVKEPELVYNRFMVAKERGNVNECLENYAIEVSYAYSLGEKLNEVLKTEDKLEYHQAVVRFIVQRIHLLKTKVKYLFADQDV